MSNESKDESAFAMDSKNGTYHGGLSKIEYAANHLKVPMSGTPWLDEMIQKSRRDEFAKVVFTSLIEGLDYDSEYDRFIGQRGVTRVIINADKFLFDVFLVVDALIKASDEGMGEK